jgi:hypothetical protein
MKSPIKKIIMLATVVSLNACSTTLENTNIAPVQTKAPSRAPASTGKEGGNGGDAVVCADGVYMLDSIETKRRGFPIQMLASGSLTERVDEVLSRLDRKNKALKEIISTHAHLLLVDIEKYESTGVEMQTNIEFTSGHLVNVADEGATYIPQGCRIEQLIIQNVKPLMGEKRFLFQKELWSQMSSEEKVVAILHEAIFTQLIQDGRISSPITRALNGALNSRQINEMTLAEFSEFSERIHLTDQWEIDGFKFNESEVLVTRIAGGLTIQGKKYISNRIKGIIRNANIPLGIDKYRELPAMYFEMVKFDTNGKWQVFQSENASHEWNRSFTQNLLDIDTFKFVKVGSNQIYSAFNCREVLQSNEKRIFLLSSLQVSKTNEGIKLQGKVATFRKKDISVGKYGCRRDLQFATAVIDDQGDIVSFDIHQK